MHIDLVEMSTAYELSTLRRAQTPSLGSHPGPSSSSSSSSLPPVPISYPTFGLDPEPSHPRAHLDTGRSIPPFIPVLLPIDQGYDAWLFLASATLIETPVWGLPFSVGILIVCWTNELFNGYGGSTVTLAATLQTGLMSTRLLGTVSAVPLFWRKI